MLANVQGLRGSVITYADTDLFTSSAQTLVNPVNTEGVMGAGIALEFRRRFPEMFKRYAEHCKAGRLAVGSLYLWRGSNRWVLCLPTKQEWRKSSRLEWVKSGLRKLADVYVARGITSVALPQLGCGRGGLAWEDVRPLMESVLASVEIPISVHVPRSTPVVVNRHHYRNAAIPGPWLYIGRGSPLGNPFTRADHGDAAIPLYREWLRDRVDGGDPVILRALAAITSRHNLACSCAPRPCHGDVVVEVWRDLQDGTARQVRR